MPDRPLRPRADRLPHPGGFAPRCARTSFSGRVSERSRDMPCLGSLQRGWSFLWLLLPSLDSPSSLAFAAGSSLDTSGRALLRTFTSAHRTSARSSVRLFFPNPLATLFWDIEADAHGRHILVRSTVRPERDSSRRCARARPRAAEHAPPPSAFRGIELSLSRFFSALVWIYRLSRHECRESRCLHVGSARHGWPVA